MTFWSYELWLIRLRALIELQLKWRNVVVDLLYSHPPPQRQPVVQNPIEILTLERRAEGGRCLKDQSDRQTAEQLQVKWKKKILLNTHTHTHTHTHRNIWTDMQIRERVINFKIKRWIKWRFTPRSLPFNP